MCTAIHDIYILSEVGLNSRSDLVFTYSFIPSSDLVFKFAAKLNWSWSTHTHPIVASSLSSKSKYWADSSNQTRFLPLFFLPLFCPISSNISDCIPKSPPWSTGTAGRNFSSSPWRHVVVFSHNVATMGFLRSKPTPGRLAAREFWGLFLCCLYSVDVKNLRGSLL